jgi:hypothetical protein
MANYGHVEKAGVHAMGVGGELGLMNKNQTTDDFTETAVTLLYQSKLHDENKQYRTVANLVADRLSCV